MSARWNSASLLEPISPEEPCGKSLEDTDALNQLDSFQIFGQSTLDPEKVAPGEKPAPARKEARKSDRPPNWQEIQDLSIEMLGWSKDLRILAHLAAAVLRTEGPQPFFQLVNVAHCRCDGTRNPTSVKLRSHPVLHARAGELAEH